MTLYVADVEGDGLYPTKMWCLSCCQVGVGKVRSTTSYEDMRKLLSNEKATIIGHNFIRWDSVHLSRVLDIEVKATIIDTLPISWYLYPERKRHGLEEWGEEFGVPKPPITDWHSLTVEEYIHRCEEDVKINLRLWEQQWEHLLELYESEEAVWEFLSYLMRKMDDAKEQERSKWKLDVERCQEGLKELLHEKETKFEMLRQAMPKVPQYRVKTRPAKPFKKDGTPSATGKKWFALLQEKGLPEYYNGEVEVLHSYKDPNPASHTQIKDWLYSLGWKPRHMKFVRNKETGEVKQIPQVASEHVKGEVCESVQDLFEKAPELELLNGLSIVSHRITILEGFLKEKDDEGWVRAEIQGLTNTLRFKHRTIVNLPGVDKAYGDLIRGVLIAPEGYELCGSDMSLTNGDLVQ